MYTNNEIINILENIDKNLTYDNWKNELIEIDLQIKEIERNIS